MSVNIVTSDKGISFEVAPKDLKSIQNWKKSVDEKVYEKQIKTEIFYGKVKLQKHIWKFIKQQAKDRKVKEPYYGSIAVAYVWEFRFVGQGCRLKIKNTLSGDKYELTDEQQKTTRKRIVIFELTPEEMERLNKWKSTKKGKGNVKDYRFIFCPTSVGTITVVRNIRTKSKIDLTDYENW